MKILSITLMVIGLFLLTGCSASDSGQKPGPVTDATVLVGTWVPLGPGPDFYLAYDDDGTFRVATLYENLTERPVWAGEYWFDEGLYFEKETDALAPGCIGIIGVYEVQLLENDHVKFTTVTDECEGRAVSTAREYERVE